MFEGLAYERCALIKDLPNQPSRTKLSDCNAFDHMVRVLQEPCLFDQPKKSKSLRLVAGALGGFFQLEWAGYRTPSLSRRSMDQLWPLKTCGAFKMFN